MRIHVEVGDQSQTVAITIDDADATLHDLTHALGIDSTAEISIDGRMFDRGTRLADCDLVEGSAILLAAGDGARDTGVAGGGLQVGVVAGPGSGSIRGFDRARVTIGRSSANDLSIANDTISSSHAFIRSDGDDSLSIEDLGSHNGSWVRDVSISGTQSLELGEQVRVGSSSLRVDRVDVADRPVGVGPAHADDNGRILINRPPRTAIPSSPEPVVVPSARPERRNPAFSVVALLVPIIFAVVMIRVTGRWQYAMFALLSPLMFLGNYASNRRRVKRERHGDDATYREGVARLADELAAAELAERVRRTSFAPDLVEVRRRIELPSSRLWERRHLAVDAMTVRLARGDVSWEAPLDRSSGDTDAEIEELIDTTRSLADIEVLADFRNGPIGLIGDGDQCRGSARSVLLQLAAHHGPADLSVVVLTSASNMRRWSWAEWLPHVATGAGGVQILSGPHAAGFPAHVLDQMSEDSGLTTAGAPVDPGFLIVVDDVELLHGRSSPTRQLLRNTSRHVFGLVIAGTEDQLPASIATIAQVDSGGRITVRTAGSIAAPSTGVADTTTVDTAHLMARALARFEDPELRMIGGNLPNQVGVEHLWADRVHSEHPIKRAWEASKSGHALDATIGICEAGPLTIDLVHDGPHGLVAGTTGSGKSEFLRTLVVGLAASHDPDDLVFVLIDYKGGSAFDCCSRLPHVVGMVTDLDDHLAERALQSLEAELHHRETLLRESEVSDIIEYRKARSPQGPLPRLVVVIDEFATLRAELPDFVAALVGVAQRGRSLGVHLILATQRPSGAVDANIRANTNLRVALRVQDSADSADVIDSKDAALIPRSAPGRAYIRRGQGDLVPVQTGYVSGPRVTSLPTPIRTAAVMLGSGSAPKFPTVESSSDLTNLETMVGAISRAAEGIPAPRRPWLDDLEPRIESTDAIGLVSGDGRPVVLAIGDDPERQRRITLGWNPLEGHLVVYGVLGSGVTTTLRSLIHRLGPGIEGRPAWVFSADHGAGGLAGIEKLGHVACRLEPTETARHDRLLTMVGELLDARREMSADAALDLPLVVLVIDGVAGFCELTDTGNAGERAELFNRIVRDGPAVGVVLVAGANRLGELPRSFAAAVRQNFVMELADPSDYQMLGIKSRNLPAFRPGRALVGPKPTVCQIIDWSGTLSDEILVVEPPPSVDKLPESIDRRQLDGSVLFEPELSIPIGVDDETRKSARLLVRGGDHVLIAGPSGSGRTSTLTTIARQLRDADPEIVLVGLSPAVDANLFDENVFDAAGTVEGLANVIEMAKSDPRRWVLLIDDADQIDLDDGPLFDIARSARAGLTLVATGRSATVRQGYGHWLRHVRSAGVGVILNPDNGVDGELLAVRLPRGVRLPELPGRGYLVRNGEAKVVQIAR